MKKLLYTLDSKIIERFLKIKQEKHTEIESINFQKHPWLKSINKLPDNIKFALLKELELGNIVSQIQDLGWPQKGSIVILLKNPFKNKNPAEIEGISFRKMNDPHYWMEDIHTIINEIEYLIIT